jgi:hypothetical protein
MPDFDFSPDRLTSTSAGIVSRFAEDSLASEWHSSQRLLTVFALRLWRWPMKCQRNASPWRAYFAQRGHVFQGYVLRGGNDCHVRTQLGADPLVVLANRVSR